MEHLPEDVLLTVMQYLDVPDLLACRLVCKRIGGLALHPHVWRRRVFDVTDHDEDETPAHYCLPVMRLAPCLARLGLGVELLAEYKLLYSITRCAVSTLKLVVEGGSAMYAALAIRNQEVLGRLKSIDVWLSTGRTSADGPALLWAVAFTAGLDTLAVRVTGHHRVISTNSLPTARPRSSLRTFTCNLRPDLGPFCDFVLASHADTMEDVTFDGECDFEALTSMASLTVASLLAGMPNLRRLHNCPLFPGLDAVAACESLELVELDVGPGMRDAVPQAGEFLRRAKQLRNVTIRYGNGASSNGVGVDLVLALVSSGPSLVESLTIIINEFPTDEPLETLPQLQPVISALPLPALQELEVSMLSEELLLAITPETNPVLRTIKLHPHAPRCAHEYLHRDSVETLLSRNPLLDLIVHATHYCPKSRLDACEPCRLGCHEEVWENEWIEERKDAFVLSMFRPPDFDYDDVDPFPIWIRIPRLNM